MRKMLYGQTTADGTWEFHGELACATRKEREQPDGAWHVTLKTAAEIAEELRERDAAVGEQTRMLYCSCLGSAVRRPVANAPAYEPEW